MTSITSKIIGRIKQKKRGWVFGPCDLLDIANRAAVDQVLSRMVKRKMIRRLSRGIYDYPRQHELLGTLSPDVDKLAKVLAGGDRIFPSGAMALNILGLSSQVPSKPVYMTNGAARTRMIAGQKITLKHARVRLFGKLSDRANLFLQAIAYLGKANIDDNLIKRCAALLSESDIRALYAIMNRIPSWLVDIIHRIELVKHGKIQHAV